MTGQVLSILLDIAVLICFAFTIFYVLKLSKSLNNFRQHRQDMNRMIELLSRNVDEALRAIEGLKNAGDKSGRDLQKVINESKAMADELQMVNETANSLASRLEGLAERSRIVPAPAFDDYNNVEEAPAAAPPRQQAAAKGAFFIQDREFMDEDEIAHEDDISDDMSHDLQSQAEKELMQALLKNKKPSSRGGAL